MPEAALERNCIVCTSAVAACKRGHPPRTPPPLEGCVPSLLSASKSIDCPRISGRAHETIESPPPL
eukprot:965566-Alexandrium_andersonii.AAC.1